MQMEESKPELLFVAMIFNGL